MFTLKIMFKDTRIVNYGIPETLNLFIVTNKNLTLTINFNVNLPIVVSMLVICSVER